tara:strand:+ start:1372 stop:1638 length:267 start_codon:yes stop_codon:yes gene_type:complete
MTLANYSLVYKNKGFDVTAYNKLKEAACRELGLTQTQLHYIKNWKLELIYFHNEPQALFEVTGKKRYWIKWQLERLAQFCDKQLLMFD